MTDKSSQHDGSALRDKRPKTLRFAMGTFGVSSLLVATPMALGLDSIAKYFMAFGFLAACLGSLCVLLGTIEWLQHRR